MRIPLLSRIIDLPGRRLDKKARPYMDGILTMFIHQLKNVLDEEKINNESLNQFIDYWVEANDLDLSSVRTMSLEEFAACNEETRANADNLR